MSFIRVKKISGAKYAYEVENYWTDKGSRQRTKEYLGRVFKPAISREPELGIDYTQELGDMAKAMARYELVKHGFDQEGKFLVWKNIRVDLEDGTFMQGDKSVVLEMNEGFLCAQSYKKLREYTPKKEKFERELATTVLGAGMAIPPELFIILFEAAKQKLKIEKSDEEVEGEEKQ